MKLYLIHTELIPVTEDLYLNGLSIAKLIERDYYAFFPGDMRTDIIFVHHNFDIPKAVINKINEKKNQNVRIFVYYHENNPRKLSDFLFSDYKWAYCLYGHSTSGPVIEALKYVSKNAGYDPNSRTVSNQNYYVKGLFTLFEAFKWASPKPKINCDESYKTLNCICQNLGEEKSCDLLQLYNRI